MASIYDLIREKTTLWVKKEKNKSQSIIKSLLVDIENKGFMREPQIGAIETYLWLKFQGKNNKLSDIVKSGLLQSDSFRKYKNFNAIDKDNYTVHFLNYFAQENGVKTLQEEIANDPLGKNIDWNNILDNLLHNFSYPNFLYSLPMGAGKTYLIATFIYLELYFARLLPNDSRFSHNFIVLAPLGSKTAILPSLQTIKNFNPEWILPKADADYLKQIIQVEILDALSSKRKDKLQGNNPNLEKVNRINQTKKFGLVFITNGEKVVMEKYTDKDKANPVLDKESIYYNEEEAQKTKKTNELREGLSKLENFSVFLDEVHHSYGKNTEKNDKKLRQIIDILNQHKNINSVFGMSGTPYIKDKITIKNKSIRINQIQDIVYNYSLSDGIGKFLKIPVIKSSELDLKVFIKDALSDFFENYDKEYENGAKSKIAFYCPNIENLNKEIEPLIEEWYNDNRPNKKEEIFKHYTDNKDYKLPKNNVVIFNNLDKPYSKKRVVLLVAIGKEGWDCKSLTSVVLPRQKTAKNFVLQTTCRCLREMDNAKEEKALIYLSIENYKTLDNELKSNYNLNIKDIENPFENKQIEVQIPKPKLGKLKYKQVSKKYTIIKKEKIDVKEAIKGYDLEKLKSVFSYNENIIEGEIGEKGLIKERYVEGAEKSKQTNYSFQDFIYELSRNTYGLCAEKSLIERLKPELKAVYNKIIENLLWIEKNPHITRIEVIKDIASLFSEEIKYEVEDIKENVEIELLQWNIEKPRMTAEKTNGGFSKFMPEIDKSDLSLYVKHPEDLIEKVKELDTRDISFNFVPYKMDSAFEQDALKEMLRIIELEGLEVYFNGYKDKDLQTFCIRTPRGNYTPDFLILKRKDKTDIKSDIEKILIIETKGETYYNEEFQNKEKFVEEVFVKHNPSFEYVCFRDKGENDFSKHLKELKEKIKDLKG